MRLPSALSWIFLAAVGCFVACGPGASAAKSDPPVHWAALPRSAPAVYTPGTTVVVTQATIDASGGSLVGPFGTPVAGVVVTFPPDAVTTTTTFSLGYDDGGTFANISAEEHPKLVLDITSSGRREFQVPIAIRYPFPDATRVPVTYHIDDDGHLRVMPPLGVERDTKLAGFLTYHLSPFVPFAPPDPNQSQSSRTDFPIFSGFFPDVNGFAFSNFLIDDYAPHGRCEGMVSFAAWYKASVGEGLTGKYLAEVPTKTKLKAAQPKPPTAQEVLATRAHLSTYLKDPEVTLFEDVPKTAKNPDGKAQIGLSANIVALQHALKQGPVAIGLYSPEGNHAVLAIGISDTEIGLYDPNYPNMIKQIKYAFDPHEPHDEGATMKYSDYTFFGLWGNGELPKRRERFEDILRDADALFHDENQTDIEITSPLDTEATSQDVVVTGKVHSGSVSISEVDVRVVYADSTESDPQTVPLEPGAEDFSVPLKLKAGDNWVIFTTRGLVVGGTNGELREVPNTKDKDAMPKDWFILHWQDSSQPNNGLTLKYKRIETTDATRTETTVELSTNFVYYEAAGMPAAIKRDAPKYDFSQCQGYQDCTIVSAMSVDKVPFLDGKNIPINVATYHTDVYEKDDTGAFQLKMSTDTPGVVACEWIGLDIVVDPGSTAGNYKYRVILSSGGNFTCPSGALQLPGLGASMTMEGPGSGDTTCVTPPTLLPADIEPWVTQPLGQKSWSQHGHVNCQSGGTTVTEEADLTFTFLPCNGAPCLP